MTLALACLAAFTVWISWRAKALELRLFPGTESTALLHKPAPAFTLKALDGSTVSLADFRGKKSVAITFWASWCGPCRVELPALRAFYRTAHKPGSDFEILAISIDDDKSAAEGYATTAKLPFPVLWDDSQKASDLYGVDSIPQLFVVDQNGVVTWSAAGYEPAFEFALANALGIKNYTPAVTPPKTDSGGADAAGN